MHYISFLLPLMEKSTSSLSHTAVILALPTVKLSVLGAVKMYKRGLKQVVTFLFRRMGSDIPPTGCINKTGVLMAVKCSPARERFRWPEWKRARDARVEKVLEQLWVCTLWVFWCWCHWVEGHGNQMMEFRLSYRRWSWVLCLETSAHSPLWAWVTYSRPSA